jgi:hypothetical protein
MFVEQKLNRVRVCLKQFCKNFFSTAKKKTTKTKGTVVVWFEFSTSQPVISLIVECILKK